MATKTKKAVDGDFLTSAAQKIGSTLGELAKKAGVVSTPAKPAPKKKTTKKPAVAKKKAPAKKKAAAKKSK
jgi:hypothetical protein